MEPRTNLTNNGFKVLAAISKGCAHNKDIADELGVTQAAVSQSLTRLKAGDFVRKLKNGELKVASKGQRALKSDFVAGPRPGSKMEAATKVVTKMHGRGKPRKDVIETLMKEVKLTKAGAATYYSILTNRIEEGSPSRKKAARNGNGRTKRKATRKTTTTRAARKSTPRKTATAPARAAKAKSAKTARSRTARRKTAKTTPAAAAPAATTNQ